MVAVAIGGGLGKFWWRWRWWLWLLWRWQALWPLCGHGCGVDDSGWPWMTVVCAFFWQFVALATAGGGGGGCGCKASVGLVVIFCCDCGGGRGDSFVVNVAYGHYCV
jgi:hypothetical protein